MSDAGSTAILLITCPDQPGLVAAVSDFVFRHGGNIIHADQHTDRAQGVFLQRVEFELDHLRLPRAAVSDAFAPVAQRFGMQWSVRFSDEVRRVALLVSRHGHCVYDLLARWRMGELAVEIPLIVANHEHFEGVARDFGVACCHLPANGAGGVEQDAALEELLARHAIDVIVLARYMRVLSGRFVRRYAGRVINIHHSFLPAFAGGRPYHQAYERGVKIIGATAHYVTAELDAGPIIDQDVVRVSHRDTVEDMIRKGRDLEKVVLARALRLHLENRVLVYGNKTVVFD